MTKFIIYATSLDLFAQEISHIHSLLVSSNTEELLVLNNKTELISLIPNLCNERTVAILFASSSDELDDLVSIKEQFGAISTVLVLPDDQTETLQRGMLFNPLYFMTKQDELRHYSLAINELCHIYEDHFNQTA